MKDTPVFLGRRDKVRLVPEQIVQAARDVHAVRKRVGQHGFPRLRNDAATIGNAEHQGSDAGSPGFLDRQIRQTNVCLAPFHAILTDSGIGTPVADSLCDLCCKKIRRVSKKE